MEMGNGQHDDDPVISICIAELFPYLAIVLSFSEFERFGIGQTPIARP